MQTYHEVILNNHLLLIKAVEANSLDEVKQLLKNPQLQPSNNNALLHAAQHGYTALVTLLIADHRFNPACNGSAALWLAVKGGHFNTVKCLLDCPRIDPTAVGNMALWYAVIEEHTEIVKLLLNDPRIDPSIDSNQLVHIAAKKKNAEIITLLLKDKRIIIKDEDLYRYARSAYFDPDIFECFKNKVIKTPYNTGFFAKDPALIISLAFTTQPNAKLAKF